MVFKGGGDAMVESSGAASEMLTSAQLEAVLCGAAELGLVF